MTETTQDMRGKIRKIRGNLTTRLNVVKDCCPQSEANDAYINALTLALREIDLQFPTL
jgi:hypothetical protein